MPEYTKRQIARHIYDLFAERPETLRAIRWACVIKNNELIVVSRLSVMPTEPIVVDCILEPGNSPSWLSIYCGVWRNWHKLVTIEI
jgi:hypothetical protein